MALRRDLHRHLEVDLGRWVAAGVLEPEQAERIRAYEAMSRAPLPVAGVAAPRRRIPVVAEALGYLGGALAATGLVLVVARYWVDMALAERLALSGAVALLLLGAGVLVHERSDPAVARLRWFLWTASTAATALFVGVLASDGFSAGTASVAAACSGGVALQSGLLWQGRTRPLQQFAFLASLSVLAGTIVAAFTSGVAPGLAIWVVGAAMLAVSVRDAMPAPWLGTMVGSSSVVIGTVTIASASATFGLPFMVASALGLLAFAEALALDLARHARIILGVVGGIGLVQALPGALGYFANGAGGATGLTTWAVGAPIVYLGARRLVVTPILTETIGGLAVIGGAALTGLQWPSFAPLFGVATAIAFVAVGMIPGQVLMSVFGASSLLVNVPWTILRLFPGEGRAPLLILVAGGLIVGIAVFLSRGSGRFPREFTPGARSAGVGTGGHAPRKHDPQRKQRVA